MTCLILTYIFVMAAKKLNFYGEKRVNIFVKNTKFRFLSKTILITFWKIYFLTYFLNFYRGYITFFRKMAKIKNFNFKTYSKILPIGMVVKNFYKKKCSFVQIFFQIYSV